jgi:hypothetical protein
MQRRTNDFMLSLPNRASDASLLQWASDVRPLEGPSKGRVDEFIEGLCSRFDSYWPDHQVTPQCTAYAAPHGGGELDLLLLVPRQDPIRALQLIRDVLRYEHDAVLPPSSMPYYWPYSGEHAASTFVIDVETRYVEGFISVTCDAAYYGALQAAAGITMAILESNDDTEQTVKARQVSQFLRRWRRAASGLDGSFVAVSILDTVAAHVTGHQPSASLASLVQRALGVLEVAPSSMPDIVGPQFDRHDEEVWHNVGALAAITIAHLFPAS